jgi:S1-C subfamily serine protease
MTTPHVYKKTFDSICTITCNANTSKYKIDGSNGFISTGTGFIINVKEKRLIIITSAHLILDQDGKRYPTKINIPITAAVNNVIKSGSHTKRNISVNLFVLGMDISADIAVLATYRKKERDQENEIYFGFDFSSRNDHLCFGDSKKTLIGTQIWTLSNAYAAGICQSTGIIHDNNLIYATNSSNYINQTSQISTSMNIDEGSSGAPIVIYKNSKVLVVGLLSWLLKNDAGNFVGGVSQKQLEKSYNKILKLNPLNNIVQPYENINFDGETGKGFLGIETYVPNNEKELQILNTKYSIFSKSKYSSLNEGFVLLSFTDENIVPLQIPNSRVKNAKNMSTGLRTGLQVDDILLKVNDRAVNLYLDPEYVTFHSYNDYKKKIKMEIIRPSTAEKMCFEVISDKFPQKYEIVSESNKIELISTFTTPDLWNNFIPIYSGISFENNKFGLNKNNILVIYCYDKIWYPCLNQENKYMLISVDNLSDVYLRTLKINSFSFNWYLKETLEISIDNSNFDRSTFLGFMYYSEIYQRFNIRLFRTDENNTDSIYKINDLPLYNI